MKNVFLAGIIQGSETDSTVSQDYRQKIREIVKTVNPEWDLYCPMEDYEKADGYPGRPRDEVFFSNVQKAALSDLLIAYIPSASMGTAVEMYEAYKRNIPVISITPLSKNWAVRFLSTKICASIEEFELFVSKGGLDEC